MKDYQKVKLFRFEGNGAEKRCVGKVNKGLKKGWTPISMSTHLSQKGDKTVILVLMGKIEEGKEKDEGLKASLDIEEEKEEEEKEGEEKEEEEKEEEEKEEEEKEEEEKEEDIFEGEGLDDLEIEEPPEKESAPSGEPKQKSKKQGRAKYKKCPRCGNIALEVEIDGSAHCEYCEYIIRDIDKIKRDENTA